MQKITKSAAQGDCFFLAVKELPKDAVLLPATDKAVVANSDSGHDHVVSSKGLGYYKTSNPLVCFLDLKEDGEVFHYRSFDTHAPFALAAGVWKVIRQRESTPEGFRRVED